MYSDCTTNGMREWAPQSQSMRPRRKEFCRKSRKPSKEKIEVLVYVISWHADIVTNTLMKLFNLIGLLGLSLIVRIRS